METRARGGGRDVNLSQKKIQVQIFRKVKCFVNKNGCLEKESTFALLAREIWRDRDECTAQVDKHSTVHLLLSSRWKGNMKFHFSPDNNNKIMNGYFIHFLFDWASNKGERALGTRALFCLTGPVSECNWKRKARCAQSKCIQLGQWRSHLDSKSILKIATRWQFVPQTARRSFYFYHLQHLHQSNWTVSGVCQSLGALLFRCEYSPTAFRLATIFDTWNRAVAWILKGARDPPIIQTEGERISDNISLRFHTKGQIESDRIY